jgi:NAD/NADP transhydrogenase alpha subunit
LSGAPLGDQVCPSSVDFFVRMIELFCESCHETQAVVPTCVIQGRSAPAVSRSAVVQSPGTAADAGQRVTETPSFT